MKYFGGAFDRSALRLSMVALLAALLSSCALLDPAYEKPAVHLVKIEPLSSRGLEQRFRVDLKIINPNRSGLSVSGMSYTLTLNGEKVVKGVTGQISEIPSYSETTIQAEASTNILAGLRLISSLLNKPGRELHYELETKLRSGWWPVPISIIESGDITLPQ
ncbi:MAG: LEA type 2 family protein [Candidatus Reddybacter sp.]